MDRELYIEQVKVKLEEVSPFDEPTSFIAAEGDEDYDRVKPILTYIDKTLDEAAHECLAELPLKFLHRDIEEENPTMMIGSNGVGRISLEEGVRLVRFSHYALHRDITSFITSEDQLYQLQQNKYTRGGVAKPIAAISTSVEYGKGMLEVYSFPKDFYDDEDTDSALYTIDTFKKAQEVLSPIEELIVIKCAYKVMGILGNTAGQENLMNEYKYKVSQ